LDEAESAVSDFLSNLMDRALGRAPTLERRRPSIFEPVAAERGRAIAVETAQEEETPQEAPVPHSAHTLAAQPDSVPAEPQQVLETGRAFRWKPEAVAPFAPPPNTSRQASEVQAWHERGEPMRPPEHLANTPGPMYHGKIHESLILTREIIREREIPVSAAEAAKCATSQADLVAPALKPTKMPDAVPAVLPPPQKPIRSSVAALTPLNALRNAPPSIPLLSPQARLMPSARRLEPDIPATRRATQLAQGAAQPAVKPAPIHISIGSIEIRTPQAPSPARPRTQPAGPKMKLDDYLAGRRGGRR
jgi:hypothetical protein